MSYILLVFSDNREGESHLRSITLERDLILDSISNTELQAIVIDNPDVETLVRKIKELGSKLEVFHYGGHSNQFDLLLKSVGDWEKRISWRRIINSLVPNRKLELVFLNGCSTLEQGKKFLSLGAKSVIVSSKLINDKAAQFFSNEFYKCLSEGNSIPFSFSSAKESIKSNYDGDYRELLLNNIKTEKEFGLFPWILLQEKVSSWRVPDKSTSSKRHNETTYFNYVPSINRPDVIGRRSDLKKIHSLLNGEAKVIITKGIGGIGKTTLLKLYVDLYSKNYNNVIWVSITGNEKGNKADVVSSMINDVQLHNRLSIKINVEKNEIERFKELVNRLESKTGENLMLIDNAGDRLNDKRIQEMLPENWKILGSSRQTINGFSQFQLKSLNEEESEELFLQPFRNISDSWQLDRNRVKYLLSYIGFHTLTIKLLSRLLAKESRLSLESLISQLQSKKLPDLRKKIGIDYSEEQVSVYEFLDVAFDLVGLNEEELLLLRHFSILPSLDIQIDRLSNLFKNDRLNPSRITEILGSLENKGWIVYDRINSTYNCNQVIQEVLRYKHTPNYKVHENVLEEIAESLQIDLESNPIEKIELLDFGLNPLQHISDPDNNLGLLSI